MKKDSHSFKAYLLKLAADYNPDDEKKSKKAKKKKGDADLPLGILKYMQMVNAGDE